MGLLINLAVTVLSGRNMKTLKRYGKKFNNSKKFINKRVKINNFIHEFGFPFSQSKSITRFLEMLNFKLEFSSVFKPLFTFTSYLTRERSTNPFLRFSRAFMNTSKCKCKFVFQVSLVPSLRPPTLQTAPENASTLLLR